jgi:hypothetical protein
MKSRLQLVPHQNQRREFSSQKVLSQISFNWTPENYFLVFIIPSKPDNVEVRKAIRQTWSNVSNWSVELAGVEEPYKKIKIMFIFGSEHAHYQDFEQELELHGNDMYIIDNLVENRDSLKYKVLWGMQQAVNRYEFTYLIKTDDDIAVNLPLLISELRTLPRERYYTGNCYRFYNGGFSEYKRWYAIEHLHTKLKI